MKNLLEKNLKDLKTFDRQRKQWLVLSIFVVVSVLSVIFEFNQIQQLHLEWLLATSGLVVAVVWWYWTMQLMKKLIGHKEDEYKILQSIVNDVREIKAEVQNTIAKSVDKDK